MSETELFAVAVGIWVLFLLVHPWKADVSREALFTPEECARLEEMDRRAGGDPK